MRVFLITLVASVVLSVMFWTFHLAHKLWPAHPLLATTVLTTGCAIALQTILRRDEKSRGK
jgi:hypothetical protein